jgi:hypothetical protein
VKFCMVRCEKGAGIVCDGGLYILGVAESCAGGELMVVILLCMRSLLCWSCYDAITFDCHPLEHYV